MSETEEHPLITDPERFVLGETRDELSLDSRELNGVAVQMLAEQAGRTLHILSRDLEPAIFSTRPLSEAVGRLARRGRHSQIRILIQDSRRLVQHTHYLLGTARQFSSYIEIRKMPTKFVHYNQAFVIADEIGVLFRQQADVYNATLSFSNASLAKELDEEFTHKWQLSEPDPYLRQIAY